MTTFVAELIADQAAHTPHALASTDAAGELSYRGLDGRANQLAHMLRAAGVRRETGVGLYLDRSRELLVALLAVFKAGGTAHLLDPRWPRTRAEAALATLPPRMLLLHEETPAPFTTAELFHVNGYADGAVSGHGPAVRLHQDNLAYVVHTSGSTGEPKAVAVTHGSISHCVSTHVTGHQIVPADRSSWLSSPGSSAGVGELWPYLATGASVHAGEHHVVASPAELRDWLLDRGITKAFLSTPTAQELAALPWPERPSLSLVTVGGDRVLRWPPATMPFEVAVSYGSAEANGVTSCLVPWPRRCTSRTATAADRAGPPPVGRPWPGVRLLVLDDDLRQVPGGGVGELFVASPELTRGYLGRPGLTAERLLPNPYSAAPGERMYQTSDLARLDGDGFVFHCGRVDNLVKIRGHRVELGDIEAALLRHDGVAAAAAISTEDGDGTSLLAAYVVPVPGLTGLTSAGVRSFLLTQLPEYLVPEAVVLVDALPRNANGKVDRPALPKPTRLSTNGGWPYRGTADRRHDIESRIRQLWKSLLDVADAKPHDNFLDRGGTSLTAGRLVAVIRDEMGIPVRLREFMRKPTLGALIDQVRRCAPRG